MESEKPFSAAAQLAAEPRFHEEQYDVDPYAVGVDPTGGEASGNNDEK
jgi:hypothetical protein